MWAKQRKAKRLFLLFRKQNLQTNPERIRQFVTSVKENGSENQRRSVHSEYGWGCWWISNQSNRVRQAKKIIPRYHLHSLLPFYFIQCKTEDVDVCWSYNRQLENRQPSNALYRYFSCTWLRGYCILRYRFNILCPECSI